MFAYILLLMSMARAVTFEFNVGRTIHPFIGRPPKRHNVSITLGACAAPEEWVGGHFGDRLLPMIGRQEDTYELCLGAKAPLWKWFSWVYFTRDHIVFGEEMAKEAADTTVLDCRYAHSDYACSYVLGGSTFNLFSDDDVLTAPGGLVGALDPGFAYDTDFIGSIVNGSSYILPVPPDHAVEIYQQGGVRRMSVQKVGRGNFILSLAIIFQVFLYVFLQTDSCGQAISTSIYVMASGAAVLLAPWSLRTLVVVPYWMVETDRSPLLLHSLWSCIMVLHGGMSNFPVVALSSIMLYQCTTRQFRVTRNPLIEAWIFIQCIIACCVSVFYWFHIIIFSMYALNVVVLSSVWTLMITYYAVSSACASSITWQFKHLLGRSV
jgi:hypothetical protein